MSRTTTPQWGTDAVDLREHSLPSLKARFLIDRLPESGQVLEIGSGGGKILRTIALHRPELELYGCDLREPQVPADSYTFRTMTTDVPFATRSMDVVLLVDVLEHVPDPRHTLAEAARVLRPGARLLAFVPIEGEWLSAYEFYRQLLGRDIYAITKEHINAFTHESARRLLDEPFAINELRYAYHALGQCMDATFFAAARMTAIRNFWWGKNVYYNSSARSERGPIGWMNACLVAANYVASLESEVLRRTRLGAAGILVEARCRDTD